jgi:hypothetical protein
MFMKLDEVLVQLLRVQYCGVVFRAFPLFGDGMSLLGVLMTDMFEALGTQWSGSMLGFISIILLPIPILLFRYVLLDDADRLGKQIRGRGNLDGDTS